MAVEIFVRGNMGEIWFLTLLPLGLYFLKRSDAEDKSWLFFTSTVVLSFVFSVHNVLSLVSVFFVGLFLFGLTHKKKALASYVSGLLLASYFLLPAVLESGLTYANEIATKTKFTDHFLCVWQLWKANKWSYGGSGIGCLNDDMSFQIGKLHILLALVGVGIFMSLFIKVKKRKSEYIPLFILVWTIFCTFLTLSISQPFWDVFSPIMASFQYPWRFLSFVLFGCAYFASYIPRVLKNKKIAVILSVALSLILLYSSTKFFSKPWKYSSDEYTSMLLTQKYIQQRAAYEIPEYFPRSGNYPMWRTYDTSEKGFSTISLLHKVNTPFYKEFITTAPISILPIHYFPFWDIRIDNIQVIPEKFDSLGRPILSGYLAHSTISVRYNETPIEKIGNGITLVIFIVLVLFCSSKKIWKKMNTILH